jgi:hypothetical protein
MENLFLSGLTILEKNWKQEIVKIWISCRMQCFAIIESWCDCNCFLRKHK